MLAVAPNETNVYESAEARFEIAAQKLGLEQGIYRYMKYPEREITVYIPVALDNGQGASHRYRLSIIGLSCGDASCSASRNPRPV